MTEVGDLTTEPTESGELSDPRKVGRKATFDRIQVRQDKADIAFILSTEAGRRFYWRLLKRCGVFESSFTGNNTTFFNEGKREIGLFLMAEMNDVKPETYVLMMEESKLDAIKKG